MNEQRNKKLYILLSITIFSILVTWIDAFVHPNYFTKIPIKILFFLILPMLYFIIHRSDFHEFKQVFQYRKKGLFTSLLLGILVYGLIVGGYFLIQPYFDFSFVSSSLSEGMGINPNNYMIVVIYISFFNSFLEEFFYRGFGFIILRKYFKPTLSYVISPLLFAFYHAGMMIGMFEPLLFILLFIALFLAGLLFNLLVSHYQSIYPSWIVHMAADLGMMSVGGILFGIL